MKEKEDPMNYKLMEKNIKTLVVKDSFKSFDGTDIYYELHGGTGPVIVLVYGVACQMNHWVYQTANLSKKFRVLLFDYRGHHKSGDSADLNLNAVATDINSLLEHLDIPSAHLVGHSFGVPVGIRFANLYPEKTTSLVFINGFVYNPLDELFKFPVSEKLINLLNTLESSAPILSQWIWKKAVNNLITQLGAGILGGFNLELIPFKDIEIYTQALENLELKVIITYMQDLVKIDLREELTMIKSPCLIISGLRDGITPSHQQDLMNSLIPDSNIEKIKDGSHCTQLDCPEMVNQLISDFFVSQHTK